jgi:CRP-like cAMP-binding protein
VEVRREGEARGTTLHGPGELIGEVAILRDSPRPATVTATRPTTLFALDRDAFRDLVAEALGTTSEFERVIRARLEALGG